MEQEVKPKLWARFILWIKKHRIILISVFGFLFVTGATLVSFILFFQKPVETVKAPAIEVKKEPAPEPIKYYSPLTGDLVADEAASKQAVTAIMIENSPDARPQSGIKKAGVVFEAIAEGGITRFLTLFQEQKPQLIGPVRSLRMYYVDWLAAFDASVAHVGGSAASLTEIRNGSYRDIDQFFNSASYWRATDRYAPHNVYTSFAKLDALNVAKGYTTSSFDGFLRTDGKPIAEPTATSVNINISSALYNSSYVYDAKTNTYARSLGGVPHLDREEGQITPSVVIALKVNESTVLEDGYRQKIDTIGSGEAVIFQNGNAIDATWSKASRKDQIVFKDINNKEIALNRGQTWISAVPNGSGSVSWQ